MKKIATIILLTLHLANVTTASESPVVRNHIVIPEDSFDFPEEKPATGKTIVIGCSPFIVVDEEPEPKETVIIEVPVIVCKERGATSIGARERSNAEGCAERTKATVRDWSPKTSCGKEKSTAPSENRSVNENKSFSGLDGNRNVSRVEY